MYIEGTGFYTFKECHKTESLRYHTATAHKERERLGDRITLERTAVTLEMERAKWPNP
jgi:hypothetical protein